MAFVFLSHSSADKKLIVRPLCHYLADHGIEVFLDEKHIEWGASIPEAVRKGIGRVQTDTAGYLLVIISITSISSRWLHHELHEAEVFRNEKDYGYILPVVLPDVDQNAARTVIGASRRYLVSDDPVEIGSAVVGIISRHHPLQPRIRWEGGERILDSWDYGLLEYIRRAGVLGFRWFEDSRWGVFIDSGDQHFFQLFKSVITPLIDLSEGGYVKRDSGQLLDECSEEFKLTERGKIVLSDAKRSNVWAWQHRIQIEEMRIVPFEAVRVHETRPRRPTKRPGGE